MYLPAFLQCGAENPHQRIPATPSPWPSIPFVEPSRQRAWVLPAPTAPSNAKLLPQSSETQHTVWVQGRDAGCCLGNHILLSLLTSPHHSGWWGPPSGAQSTILSSNVRDFHAGSGVSFEFFSRMKFELVPLSFGKCKISLEIKICLHSNHG